MPRPRRPKLFISSVTLAQDTLALLDARTCLFPLNQSLFIAILVHNDLEGPGGEKTESASEIQESLFSRSDIPLSMPMALAKRGQRRARALGYPSFSRYVEQLIRRNVASQSDPLILYPRTPK